MIFFLVSGEGSNHVLVAAGDISCPEAKESKNSCQGKKVYRAFSKEGNVSVLALGDLLQKSKSNYSSYQRNFFRTWPIRVDLLKPVAGNHDYKKDGRRINKDGYSRFLKTRSLDHMKDWYSWDRGNWHFVALNSNCDWIDCSLDGRQLSWLAKDLSQSRDKCLAAYFHHPLFVAKGRRQIENRYGLKNIWYLLSLWQATFVLNGHMHYYERTGYLNPDGEKAEKGIRQFTIGSGGVSLFALREHHVREKAKKSYGYLRLALSGDKYHWNFIDTRSRVLDSGQDSCHKGDNLLQQKEYLAALKENRPAKELRKTLLRLTE